MNHDRHEATQQPTLRRIKKAREDGHVALSSDLSSALILCVIALLFFAWLPLLLGDVRQLFVTCLNSSEMDLSLMAEESGWSLIRMIAVPCLLFFVVAVGTGILQVGGLFSPKIVMPSISNLLGNLTVINAKTGMNLLFSVSKLILPLGAGLLVLLHYTTQIFEFSLGDSLIGYVSLISTICFETALATLSALFILALCDYCWKRHIVHTGRMMTRQEVIDEQREYGAQRPGSSRHAAWLVRKAPSSIIPSLIIAGNKLAVSLRWNPTSMTAPVVLDIFRGEAFVNKLQSLRSEGISIIENNLLAQQIMQGSDVGLGIPSQLHGEIASLMLAEKKEDQ